MKLVFISDTHSKHDELVIPESDVIIHSGDATMTGSWDELKNFITWFGNLPHKHKIFIAGNHDLSLDSQDVYDNWAKRRGRGARDIEAIKKKAIDMMVQFGIIYLNDSGVEIDGIKFWGSPVQPEFYAWAFNRQRDEDIQKHWDMIPQDVEVLVTHGPPYGIMDYVPWENVGCENLRNTILTLPKLRIHAFGHLHENYGTRTVDRIVYINASNMNDAYNIVNKPIEWELK